MTDHQRETDPATEMQEATMHQGQRAIEQLLDLQQNMARMTLSALKWQETAQEQGLEFTKSMMNTFPGQQFTETMLESYVQGMQEIVPEMERAIEKGVQAATQPGQEMAAEMGHTQGGQGMAAGGRTGQFQREQGFETPRRGEQRRMETPQRMGGQTETGQRHEMGQGRPMMAQQRSQGATSAGAGTQQRDFQQQDTQRQATQQRGAQPEAQAGGYGGQRGTERIGRQTGGSERMGGGHERRREQYQTGEWVQDTYGGEGAGMTGGRGDIRGTGQSGHGRSAYGGSPRQEQYGSESMGGGTSQPGSRPGTGRRTQPEYGQQEQHQQRGQEQHQQRGQEQHQQRGQEGQYGERSQYGQEGEYRQQGRDEGRTERDRPQRQPVGQSGERRRGREAERGQRGEQSEPDVDRPRTRERSDEGPTRSQEQGSQEYDREEE